MRLFARFRWSRVLYLFGAALIGVFLSFQSPAALPAAAQTETTVIVHYHRFDNNYTGWNLWLWPYQPQSLNGAAYNFTGTDSFGVVSTAQVPGNNTEVGVIVRLGNWQAKDVSANRYIKVTNGKVQIWLVEGNPTVYYSQAAATQALQPSITNAFLDGARTIYASLNSPAPASGAKFSVTDETTHTTIPVTAVTPDNATTLLKLTLAAAPNVTHTLMLRATGFTSVQVVPRRVLNLPQYYYGGTLGNAWTPGQTSFRVWAPTASQMELQLFSSATGSIKRQIPMQQGTGGTWRVTVPGNLDGWYYLYRVTIDGQTQTAVDPYATAIAPGATRAMIVNLAKTNPAGWNNDHYQGVPNPVDAVVYEVSVRDFSIDPNGGFKHPGQYLAFTEHGTRGPNNVKTGLDSLKQLGVNYVQIMPVQEFPDPGYTYNWGYDTQNFNAPEGMYATTPLGAARITQLKQMIQSLHQAHIGVIMDVVYNHTFAVQGSALNTLVPGYFWRTDYQGNYYNGSGVGNEVASERPMVQKFILDSLKYWVTQYHVNGFRFDLMALLGVDTMKKVSQELHAIDPNIILYGEPWTGGTSGLAPSQLLVKGSQQGLGIGVFNDNFRNAIEANVFQPTALGYAMGGFGYVPAIENGVVGSINYNSQIHDFAAAPSETVNYVTSHDNYTLWDKLKLSNPSTPKPLRIQMDELAQSIVMTSQGIAFLQGGEEMLRTKNGNGNSYNAGDAVNEFNWARKAQYLNVFNYYAGLIHLRVDHPAFRMTTALQIKKDLQFIPSPNNTVAFELINHANGDPWKNIVVIYNPGGQTTLRLPSGHWNIVGTTGQVGERTLGHAQGTVTVPAITCEILYQNNARGH